MGFQSELFVNSKMISNSTTSRMTVEVSNGNSTINCLKSPIMSLLSCKFFIAGER